MVAVGITISLAILNLLVVFSTCRFARYEHAVRFPVLPCFPKAKKYKAKKNIDQEPGTEVTMIGMLAYFRLLGTDIHCYFVNDLLGLAFATLAFKHVLGDKCFGKKHVRFTVKHATVPSKVLKSAVWRFHKKVASPLIATLLSACVSSLFVGIAAAFLMVYPVGILQCGGVFSGATASGDVGAALSTAEKAYMAICLLADGVMDDLLFNIITVSLIIVDDGNLNGSVYVSLVFSSLIIIKRVLRSYYDLIAPYHDRIFAIGTILPMNEDEAMAADEAATKAKAIEAKAAVEAETKAAAEAEAKAAAEALADAIADARAAAKAAAAAHAAALAEAANAKAEAEAKVKAIALTEAKALRELELRTHEANKATAAHHAAAAAAATATQQTVPSRPRRLEPLPNHPTAVLDENQRPDLS